MNTRQTVEAKEKMPEKCPLQLSVILDLDNTLIFSRTANDSFSDFTIQVETDDQNTTFYVDKRPFLDSFLTGISRLADIYLFTNSEPNYATAVANYIDPFGLIFKGIFTRRDCKLSGTTWTKEYSHCGTDMNFTIIVDDDSGYFGEYAGIKVEPYFGQRSDAELPRVLDIVQSVHDELKFLLFV